MSSSQKRASCCTVIGMICVATFLLVYVNVDHHFWWKPEQEKVEITVNTQGTYNVLLYYSSLLRSHRHQPTMVYCLYMYEYIFV